VQLSGNRVFVTGSAVLSGGIDSVPDLWSFASKDCKVSGAIPADAELAAGIGLSAGDLSILSRHQVLALTVAERACHAAGLSPARNRLRGEGSKQSMPRFGCVAGSSLGGLVAMEQDFEECRDRRFSPYALSRWRGNAVGSVVALRHGLSGTVLSLNAASATGAQILWMAGTLIRGGLADAVVAVAADQSPSSGITSAMGRNGSISRDGSSAPLSESRSGMNPAEGAACLILESEAHARARSAVVIAEWLGGASRNEARHLQAPDPDGRVLEEEIREALDEFLPEQSRVDWVSLHATGTSRYDMVEAAVTKRVFGEKLPWISAFKRTTGHALSASGLLEAALLSEGLRSGKMPPQLSGIDHSLGLVVEQAANTISPRIALQIGQGMGGDVVVNVLARVSCNPPVPTCQ
jgi:3-oxoacyl-[acyl-carrier-protein] synthase II